MRAQKRGLGAHFIVIAILSLIICALGLEGFWGSPPTPDEPAIRAADAAEREGAAVATTNLAAPNASAELRVLTYNIFMRPPPVSWADDNHCRARALAERLKSDELTHDIIALNESFDHQTIRRFSARAAELYPHQILGQPGARGLAVNGGVSILSRYPIEAWRAIAFKKCSGRLNDCLANKGFVWAKIRLSDDFKINILATHLNSGGAKKARQVRRSQLEQIRAFMGAEESHSRWPTLLLGDLNINGLRWEPRHPSEGRRTEYARAMEQLGQTCLTCEDEACEESCHPYPIDTFRAYHGPWRFDADGTLEANTYNCISESLMPCVSPNSAEYWRRRMRIDYILDFGPPSAAPGRALELLTAESRYFTDNTCDTTYLSDHRAVQARFALPHAAPKASIPQRRQSLPGTRAARE